MVEVQLTAGLKSPPLILKKAQTFTKSEKPYAMAIYMRVLLANEPSRAATGSWRTATMFPA
jgi:hypothetical protein